MRSAGKNTIPILFIVICYFILIIFKGFNYASGDVVDVMSYAFYLQDNSQFKYDFYVQNISKIVPNERYFFSLLLSLTGNGIKYLPFVFHTIFSLNLIYFIYRISSLYIRSVSLIFLMILILLLPLNKFNLGGNELYYNMFIASNVSKSLGIASLYYFITRRFNYSFFLLIPATLIHPTAGLQLFIIFSICLLIDLFQKKERINYRTIHALVFFLITAGFYVFVLMFKVESSAMDNKLFYEIFEFRNAHHFFPEYFPLSSYLIEVILFLAGILMMIKFKLFGLLKICITIIVGIIAYLFGIYFVQSGIMLGSQWFKATIWLELIALIACFIAIDRYRIRQNIRSYDRIFGVLLLVMLSACMILFLNGNRYFISKPYSFFYGNNLSPEEEIGLLAKKNTPDNAVFIYPIEFTGYKLYSERSAYIDFKSVVHRRDALGEWYTRIREVYGIDINDRRSYHNLFSIANKNYISLSTDKLQKLKEIGVDYMVQDVNADFHLPVFVENKNFKVYILN